MKTKKTNRRFGVIHSAKHIVKEQKELAQERIREIQATLRMHHAGLERIYAFASGAKTLQKAHYSKRARNYRRTLEDEQRLQWTVENVQGQIVQLQQELFQLTRSLL